MTTLPDHSTSLEIATMEEGHETHSNDVMETITLHDETPIGNDASPPEITTRQSLYTKSVVGFLFAAFIVFIIVDSATNKYALSAIEAFLEWVEDNPVEGVFTFIFGTSLQQETKMLLHFHPCRKL